MLAWIGVLILAATATYSLLAMIATIRGQKRRVNNHRDRAFEPPVTILKPLCGEEAELDACLRSFCNQRYDGPCQIVFGLQDPADPALVIVERLKADYPDLDIDIRIQSESALGNRKVANLAQMMPAARHDHLIVADSDIRVRPDYLARVMAPLADPAVGVVTCLYRGRPTHRRWSYLASLFIDQWFAPTVWIGRLFGSRDYAGGATMAFRRADLEAVGGFAVLADQLADDHMLGMRIRELGRDILLSDVVVDTVVDEPRLADALAHEIRWMRTIRSLAPGSYYLFLITCTLPVALFGTALAAARPTALGLLATTVAARVGLHGIQNRCAGRGAGHGLWLWPIREFATLCVWIGGLRNGPIIWRGRDYKIQSDGSLQQKSTDYQ